jgi:hypothetical protein
MHLGGHLDNLVLVEIEDSDLVSPTGPPTTYIQIMTAAINSVREQHLVEILEGALAQYEAVLVVYGGNHLTRQRGYWESQFGKSVDIKPY